MTNTINAAANPALANDLLNKALNEKPAQENAPQIVLPSDVTVNLPGGYITATGEVLSTAEVKELNGKDEEAISRATTLGKALVTILQRGTVKIGSEPATEQMLDQLLVDRRSLGRIGLQDRVGGVRGVLGRGLHVGALGGVHALQGGRDRDSGLGIAIGELAHCLRVARHGGV